MAELKAVPGSYAEVAGNRLYHLIVSNVYHDSLPVEDETWEQKRERLTRLLRGQLLLNKLQLLYFQTPLEDPEKIEKIKSK